LKFEKVERRGKEVYKLLTTIQADKLYSLESGYDSHFSKGLLMALAALNAQQIQQPITIQPAAGDDDAVLFCRVWAGSEIIKAPYNDDTDWREIAQSVGGWTILCRARAIYSEASIKIPLGSFQGAD
jgi:hypothetical protein